MSTTEIAAVPGVAVLPVETFQAGETVLARGSSTGRLLILETGAVEVVKDGVQICEVRAPGALLGELAVLLDRPHTAEVRALEVSTCRVADADAFLHADPAAALYVARVLAERVDAANRAMIEATRACGPVPPRGTVGRLLDRIAGSIHYDCCDGPFPWYSIIPPALLAAVNRLPLETYHAGQTVLAAGATSGRLLILEEGSVEMRRDGMQIGKVMVRGSVLGEIAALLDHPHTADVRALETSTFHVTDADRFLRSDPAAAHYVAVLMAKRVDRANRTLIEARHQLEAEPHRGPVATMLDRIARSLHHAS